jgi:hypothetical protein
MLVLFSAILVFMLKLQAAKKILCFKSKDVGVYVPVCVFMYLEIRGSTGYYLKIKINLVDSSM